MSWWTVKVAEFYFTKLGVKWDELEITILIGKCVVLKQKEVKKQIQQSIDATSVIFC